MNRFNKNIKINQEYSKFFLFENQINEKINLSSELSINGNSLNLMDSESTLIDESEKFCTKLPKGNVKSDIEIGSPVQKYSLKKIRYHEI
ncbi:hypothetical protein KQX54_015408 [Cotesia glomerata]|uniref:Uncharacterized protein n=1 Tax=Cotesia glomerata TaxID=32391 RepID=A0AAV7I7X5_COTGL|nr:hypothetical protein KQX54_015408 [Cotesia glomerata]